MITEELKEEYEKRLGFVHNVDRDPISDMSLHFPKLREVARDCYFIVEFGVSELGSSWALLAGLADRSGTWIEPCVETGRYLNRLPLYKLVSVDHIHPNEFGGDLERLNHINNQMSRLNGLPDDVYAQLVDREFDSLKLTLKDIVKFCNELLPTLEDEI